MLPRCHQKQRSSRTLRFRPPRCPLCRRGSFTVAIVEPSVYVATCNVCRGEWIATRPPMGSAT